MYDGRSNNLSSNKRKQNAMCVVLKYMYTVVSCFSDAFFRGRRVFHIRVSEREWKKIKHL